MKKAIVLLTASFLITATNIFAQATYKEEVDAAQAIFGKAKKELVAELIKLTPDEAAKFWPVYDAYEAERKVLGQQRLELIMEVAEAYDNMTAEKADAITSKTMKLSKQNDKLLATYYKKVKKATNSNIAFEFYQEELYLLTEIRAELMSEIPLYSEIKPVKK